MIKEKTVSVIRNTLEQFCLKTEFLSCKAEEGAVCFKFKVSGKINADKVLVYAEDIRMALSCREKVEIEVTGEKEFDILLPYDFGEEQPVVAEEPSFDDESLSSVEKAVKAIKKDLKEGKTCDMLTLMKAVDPKYADAKRAKKIEEDDQYLNVLEYAVRQGTISISEVQRKFQCGFIRAARYIDDFENKGYISPSEGTKNRKVNITEEEFKEKYKR
ncbi:MAG: hypothetical protein J5911_01805 [Clostridia bacterium]|nr:hypothetical protein [Clostridia bacterium]